MAGYKYHWKCPKCRTSLELKMRVTQTKRKCPHCGEPVTPEEIDNQANMNAIGSFIGSAIMVATILLCCKVCPNNSSPNSEKIDKSMPTVSETVGSPTANLKPNVPTGILKSEEKKSSVDLSTPENAFLAHVMAMKNRDVDGYIETLSKKKINQDLNGVLSKDGSGKKRESIQAIVDYWFSIWQCRGCEPPDVIKSGFELMDNPLVRGTKAAVFYRDNSSNNFKVARLTKEDTKWKVDTYLDYPKQWEEKEFYQRRRDSRNK